MLEVLEPTFIEEADGRIGLQFHKRVLTKTFLLDDSIDISEATDVDLQNHPTSISVNTSTNQNFSVDLLYLYILLKQHLLVMCRRNKIPFSHYSYHLY